ncbi:hypothetical protein J2128_000801 [Methanomicrobium sp. W14]|uniref:DUF5806 family protein n=1 Tax=Methanomicrobium sp. W14 TaxID=2817839 RepID=UPI001FDAA494|nr:DUF5806 family protein [Methanomicrobium sp. W14]MBP2132880.1 hypothetical protein [Methanomicrobium sp. W14]
MTEQEIDESFTDENKLSEVISKSGDNYSDTEPGPDDADTTTTDNEINNENNSQINTSGPKEHKLTTEDKERINKYKKFKKVDGSAYRRVNTFLRKHTYITAREWAIARLCADFTTRGGAEMTFIGENLPELVPFMTDTYTPQAVNQARSSFKKKVKKSGATFFYGALCGFFTADELDDILFESSEVARFLLEIEGTSVDIDDEIETEDQISDVMRSVAEAASMIRKPKNDKEQDTGNKENETFNEGD